MAFEYVTETSFSPCERVREFIHVKSVFGNEMREKKSLIFDLKDRVISLFFSISLVELNSTVTSLYLC